MRRASSSSNRPKPHRRRSLSSALMPRCACCSHQLIASMNTAQPSGRSVPVVGEFSATLIVDQKAAYLESRNNPCAIAIRKSSPARVQTDSADASIRSRNWMTSDLMNSSTAWLVICSSRTFLHSVWTVRMWAYTKNMNIRNAGKAVQAYLSGIAPQISNPTKRALVTIAQICKRGQVLIASNGFLQNSLRRWPSLRAEWCDRMKIWYRQLLARRLTPPQTSPRQMHRDQTARHPRAVHRCPRA